MLNFFLLKLAVKAKSLLGLKSFGTIWKNKGIAQSVFEVANRFW